MATRKSAKKKAVSKPKAGTVEAPAESEQAQTNDAAPRVHGPVMRVTEELSILGDERASRGKGMQQRLVEAAGRRTASPRPATFKSALQVQHTFLPLPHFQMQWMTDTYGYPSSGTVMLIGDPHCGKTTKVFSDIGHIMLERNAAVLYLSCEGAEKTMRRDRILRCLHTDPKIGIKLLDNIAIEMVYSVVQLMPKMESWAKLQREGGGTVDPLPKYIPLIIVIDPLSRLMSAAEAEGNIEWDKLGKESAHEPGTGSNFGHSKFANAFSRWLPSFSDRYNVLNFIVNQRTEKIDMSSNGSKATQNMSEWKKALYAYTCIGGKALEGVAALVILMTSTELVKDPLTDVIRGRRVRARVRKQSHGIAERMAMWELRMHHDQYDRDGYLDPPIDYADGFCAMLKENGLLGVNVGADGLVSSKDLGFRGFTPAQADRFIHANPETLTRLGKALGISGYVSLVDDVLKELSQPANG